MEPAPLDDPARRGPALPTWLAAGGWTITVALTALVIAVRLLGGVPPAENRFQFGDASMAAILVFQIAYASVGAVVAARRPRHPVGWLLLLVGFLYAVQMVAVVYLSAALAGPAANTRDAAWAAVVADASTFLGGTCLFSLLIVFPDGRVPILGWKRWRWWVLAADVPLVVALAVRPGELWLFPQIENPLAASWASAWLAEVPALPGIFIALVTIGLVWVIAVFIARARSARGVARQQIKWFALSAVIACITLGVATLGGALRPGASPAGELPLTAFLLSASLMPVAIGIAILRYRLYDIDLIIRRTLIYGALTVGLGALYGALVLFLQGALASFAPGSTLAVAGSTLAVATLFQPARRGVQAVVDRRFYRSRYDAARTVDAFSARLRDQVDLERLTDELRRVTRETVRPATVSVWLRGDVAVS
jgi:hypothetical protein